MKLNRSFLLSAVLGSLSLFSYGEAVTEQAPAPQAVVRYPGLINAGSANLHATDTRFTLSNNLFEATWVIDKSVKPVKLFNRDSAEFIDLSTEAFVISFDDRPDLLASKMQVIGEVETFALEADATALPAARQYNGHGVRVKLRDPLGEFTATWTATLRNESAYVRTTLTITADDEQTVELGKITLFHQNIPGSRMIGQVQGSVMGTDSFYMAYEHPMAENTNGSSRAELSAYSKDQMSADTDHELTFDISNQVTGPGIYKAEIRHYAGENRLMIQEARLLADGKVVARDRHEGYSDNETDVNQFYTLPLDTFNPDAEYTLEINMYGKDGGDTAGMVFIERHAKGDLVSCSYARNSDIKPGESYSGSLVIGTYPENQLRRAFLAYLERERTHPYRAFLHYNSWYDIGYFNKYDAKDCLAVIEAFGEELVKKRGVKFDSLLFDDGWDNDETLWLFHDGFPNGLTPVTEKAQSYGIDPGIWLSPWGGYGKPRERRIAAGREAGFEIYENETDAYNTVFKMSGPKYYERFSTICKEMVSKYGVNQFKFDGIGGNSGSGADDYAPDFEAALQLIKDLRDLRSDVYINLTTGTWPSPFWLMECDSIWRGGYDHEFVGEGSERQKWLNYRDGMTYERIVARAPLYPINSLMVHGAILAKQARGLKEGSDKDFRDEVRSMFGGGSQLQELYISHELMNDQKWDDLAEAAKWARANANVLVDVHWVGGNPIQGEIYGFAAWTPEKGTLTLRNPSNKKQAMVLNLSEVMEVPANESIRHFVLRCPFNSRLVKGELEKAQRIMQSTLPAKNSVRFTMEPHEVLVFDVENVR